MIETIIVVNQRAFMSAAVVCPAPDPDNHRRLGEYWSLHKSLHNLS
jgi:hypothetical protein